MRDALAIMISLTTHGAPLREKQRRWVDQEIIMPAQPVRQEANEDAEYPPLVFSRDQLQSAGTLIGTSLKDRLQLPVWALTVQMWYTHFVVAATTEPAGRIVACTEEAVRRGLGLKRPVWEDQYDKRLCFDRDSIRQRIAYVERNNVAAGLPAKPWPFIEAPSI